ncbi:MAG: hypothetical protein EX271_03010 [Acidimicrobiales bacterium]|nr:hypothetical protein [Hyphomonadaceae bacterium]RZV43854.1 MAG: hypothetical protein EX271_03010 [Acidimicrobiales bacterium]
MKKILIGVGLLFAVACTFVLLFVEDVDVTISESTVQQSVNAQIEKGSVRSLGINLTLNSAIVDFKANNTAAINVDIDADGYGYAGKLRGDMATGIRYNQPRLYLADVQSTGLETVVEEDVASEFSEYRDVANNYIKREKEKLLAGKEQNALGRIVANSDKKAKDYAVNSAKVFFETVPIYNLNNAGLKGSVASLALKDVTFTEDSAVVTLSPRQAVIKILTYIAGMIAIVVYLLYKLGLLGFARRLVFSDKGSKE